MLKVLVETKEGRRLWHTATTAALRWVRRLGAEAAEKGEWEILTIQLVCPRCGQTGPAIDGVCNHCWHISPRDGPAVIYWGS